MSTSTMSMTIDTPKPSPREFTAEEQRLLEHGPGSLDLSDAPLVWGPCPGCGTDRFGLVSEGFWLPGVPCRACGASASWERDLVVLPGGLATVSLTEEGAMAWTAGEARFEVPLSSEGPQEGVFSWADLAGMAGLLDQGVTESKVAAMVALRQEQWLTGDPQARLLVEMLLNPLFLMATPAENDEEGEDGRMEAFSQWSNFQGYYNGDDLSEIKDVARVLTNYIEWRCPRVFYGFGDTGTIDRAQSLFGLSFLSQSADGEIEYGQVEIYCTGSDVYLTSVKERKNLVYRRDAEGFGAAIGWLWMLVHEYLALEKKAYGLGLIDAATVSQGRPIGVLA